MEWVLFTCKRHKRQTGMSSSQGKYKPAIFFKLLWSKLWLDGDYTIIRNCFLWVQSVLFFTLFCMFYLFWAGYRRFWNSLMQSAAVSGQSGRFCSGFYWKQVPKEGILSILFLWSALRGMWEAPDVFIRPSQTKVCFARIESWSSASEIGISSKSKTTRKYNDFRGGEEGGRGRVDWGQLGPSWSSNSSGDENCLWCEDID